MNTVERLVAYDEIARLKARYFRCVDLQGTGRVLAKVFSNDGIMDVREALRGHAAGGSSAAIR